MSLHQRVDVCVIFLKFLHNGRQTSHQPLVLLYITEPNLKSPVTLKFRRRLVSYSKRKPFPAGSTNHAEIELNLFKIFVAATLRPTRGMLDVLQRYACFCFRFTHREGFRFP